MNLIERIMLQHANPWKLAIDCSAMVIAFVFLFEHQLLLAMIFLFGLSFLGTAVAWGRHEDRLAKTALGRFMLGQANPMNLFVRGIGFIFMCLGFWHHSVMYFILGCILAVAARLWKKNRFVHE